MDKLDAIVKGIAELSYEDLHALAASLVDTFFEEKNSTLHDADAMTRIIHDWAKGWEVSEEEPPKKLKVV